MKKLTPKQARELNIKHSRCGCEGKKQGHIGCDVEKRMEKFEKTNSPELKA